MKKLEPKTWQDEALIGIAESLASIAASLKLLTRRRVVAKVLNGIQRDDNNREARA